MKAFIGFLIIIATLYIIALFTVPEKVKELTKPYGLESLNNTITGFKSGVDETADSLGVRSGGILDGYQNILGEAREVINTVASGSLEVKGKIDGVRNTLSGAESTVKSTIETGTKVMEKVQEVKETLNDVEKLGDSLKGFVNTGAIQ